MCDTIRSATSGSGLVARLGALVAAAALVLPLNAMSTIIDFDAGTDGAAVGEDYAALGVHFGTSWKYYDDNGANGTGGDYPATSNPNSAWGTPPDEMTIVFDEPVVYFRFTFNNGAQAKLNGWAEPVTDMFSCVLCDIGLPAGSPGNVVSGSLAAIFNPGFSIRSLRFFANDLTIDDLEFRTLPRSVPEPAGLLLLGLGFAALMGTRRRLSRQV